MPNLVANYPTTTEQGENVVSSKEDKMDIYRFGIKFQIQ
ncbi:hypothetical protein T4D_15830 [Trichinella pseudospiralis]|uniref:Uncharacterized protein n=1 Tax=Trichinella pseudospiralis TaxID=6337 RepID=A0A0V1DPW8_TRIPS|nr:hypothetical protein T4D_15830 [Trichinella pseudospiralis]